MVRAHDGQNGRSSRDDGGGGVSIGGEALRLVSVSKVYGADGAANGDRRGVRKAGAGAGGAGVVAALREVSLALSPGTFTAVMGPSGSGKSTLLHCASGLDRPSSGQVQVGGRVMEFGSEARLARFRRGRIGFVFQHFNLLPALTVRQNIALPSLLAGREVDEARLAAVVERVGLAGRLGHRPGALSGGEQQRVAIARALVTRPDVVFADEPTGALDSAHAGEVLELFGQAVREFGQTVVMVTHDPVAASHAGRVLFLLDGRIEAEMDRPEPSAVAEQMARLGGRLAGRRTGSGV